MNLVGMGNLLCQNTNKRKKTTVRDVSAFEAGNEVSSSVVVEMSSRRLSSEDTGSRKLDKDTEEEIKTDEESEVRCFSYIVEPYENS